jgi:phosphoglycolate phosphatase-like HAD superfamily hydrolase
MHCNKSGKETALDADGVLLDYHAAYGAAWERAFRSAPAIRDSRAYWPIDRWAVEHMTGTRLAHFQAPFDESFWATIPAIDEVVDACLTLVSAGFELICVTAMDITFAAARLRNQRTEVFRRHREMSLCWKTQGLTESW